ncbi:PaaI family thioesterase [Paenibacillus senegalimassiliensis]|uniref:PaaI family thioesterase n=1 Tax=Paenibacillus senegalimassiliensis TaxID=1737426 RepID=UPI00073EB705|nr:PaaI family thioesterase [Paenibacillus senegalimassiliensis]
MEWNEEVSRRNEQSFWGLLGLKMINADSSQVELGLTAGDSHLNAMGIVHGGVLSSMMDQAMGTMVATLKGKFGVTTHLNVNFLSPMRAGELVATAFPLHETYRTITLRSEVRDEEGTLGCISTATFRLLKQE